MAPGALESGKSQGHWPNCPHHMGPLMAAAVHTLPGADWGLPNPCMFRAAAMEYFRLYGGGVELLAKIGKPFC
jgi:hypothetical protein